MMMKVTMVTEMMVRRMKVMMMVIIQETGGHLQYQKPSPPPIFLSERAP